MLLFGAAARVELMAQVDQVAEPRLLEIEMTRAEALRLGLESGQQVRVIPRKLKLFDVSQLAKT